MPVLMHALPEAEWAAAQRSGSYRPPSFEEDGYIELVPPTRIVDATNERYAGQERDDISIFAVYTQSLGEHLRYETTETGEVPRLHRSITPDGVAKWGPFPRDRHGFHLPKWAVEMAAGDRVPENGKRH